MRVLCVTFTAALLAAGLAAADGGSTDDQGSITKEWSWLEGTSLTTFTAYGPTDQVNSLDPQENLSECQGCLLASSVQYGPEDEATLIEVAEPDGAGR